jgi:leucyl aminopeptidase
MKIQSTDTPLQEWSGDCLGVGFFEDQVEQSETFSTLNAALDGLLQEVVAESEFKGKSGETTWLRSPSNALIARKVVLVGLGKPENWTLESLRQAAAAICRTAHKQKAKGVAIALPPYQDAALTAEAIVEGAVLSLHQDNRFKSETENGSKLHVEHIELLGLGAQEAAITKAQQICEGVILARELVNAPANVVTPMSLADTAAELAQSYGLTLEVLEKEACEALGMGAFLGVAQASEMPPKFIHLTYKPSGTPMGTSMGTSIRKLAIIGKGLTFDSGGLNIKPTGSGIETMKMDMAGSAAVFGAAKVVGLLKPDVEVHFIVAATENMISGRAIHPGDVLTASNGKTIEINNTDAEGRLTLADALVFAEKLGVDAIVDLATLTGACVVALGNDIAGVWSPQDALAHALLSASEQAGEKMWRMPLEDKYFDGMKSMIADMKNTGPRPGGSITAALFLKQFVKETPWAHLDIAGPVWTEKESGYHNAGATGFGVRTLVNWVLSAK